MGSCVYIGAIPGEACEIMRTWVQNVNLDSKTSGDDNGDDDGDGDSECESDSEDGSGYSDARTFSIHSPAFRNHYSVMVSAKVVWLKIACLDP